MGQPDAPSPIPWLGKVGPVEALDTHLFAPPPPPKAATPSALTADVASRSPARQAEAARLQREVVAGAEPTGPARQANGIDAAKLERQAEGLGAAKRSSQTPGLDAAKLERTMAARAAARLRAASEVLGLGTPRDEGRYATRGPSAASVGGASAASASAAASVGQAATPGAQASAAAVPIGGAAGAKPARPKKLDPKRPGSGIPARRVIRTLVWARRFAQAFFFALFMYFLFQTTFRGSFNAAAGEAVRLPLPVEAFLLADPFVAAMTLLSTHTVYRGLLWSLGLLAVTLVFGRVFCGWICPFGTLHHFTAWLLPSRVGRGGSRVEANKTHDYQRAKYYLLYFFLVAALAGSALGGLFDPICIVVRSIGLAALPAAQYVTGHGLSVASESNNRALQALGDGTQDLLAAHVWNAKQFYYHHAWLVGFLLVAVLFMNRFIPRFWCRVLCPLGAFLGVFARYALFGMEKDHAKCTDCNLGLVNCQGADSPQGGVKHRQDE
ncbi:MAG TPA: 4Fe-4S binding protein, partial [Polyangiaceae bacterium]|nr:4Fe-4S binding protein [Polyangiaceae bacterium]